MSTAVATGMAPAHGGFRRPGKGKADPDERKRDTNGLFSSDEEEGDEAVRREEEEEEDAAAAAAGGLSDSSSIGAASSDSSSIGDNSASEEEEDGEEDEDEVQSKASDAAGLGMMGLESLEDALPSKRGLSNFYAGKSKSFTSLAEAAAKAAATEIAKPENPFNKRRRVLAAWSRRRASCSALATAYLPALLAPDHAVLEEDDEEGADDDSDDDDGQCGGGKGRRERRGPPSFPPPRLISQMTRNTNAGSFRSPRSFSMTDLQSASCNLAEN